MSPQTIAKNPWNLWNVLNMKRVKIGTWGTKIMNQRMRGTHARNFIRPGPCMKQDEGTNQ